MSTISWAASSQLALMPGLRRTARHIALASTSSGVTLTSRNSLSFFSRSTSSIVALTSTVTHSVTCGAVKAERDHGLGGHLAHALDGHPGLPLAASPTGPSATPPAPCRRDAGAPLREAAASTSARVTMPPSPVGVTRAEVDAEVLGELAHRRLGQRASALARQGELVRGPRAGATATSVPGGRLGDRPRRPVRGRRLASVCLTP